jgi:hypothetical protein
MHIGCEYNNQNNWSEINYRSTKTFSTVMELLVKKYAFELIPRCPASTEAGYTDEDRLHAESITGPVVDGDVFYYVSYTGPRGGTAVKSSILVCRYKEDGKLKYCVNCNDYNLDQAATFVGPSRSVSRSLIAIDGDRLFLVSGSISNIGPQLYCVDKHTGNHIWSIAYYIPIEAEEQLSAKYITKKGDYSRFFGTNSRINTYDPKIVKDKFNKTYVYIGASSDQNVGSSNVGLVPGTPYYNTYPAYTDNGMMACIDVSAEKPVLVSQLFTCPKNLVVGDIISNSGPDEKNPFLSGKNEVIIETLTNDKIKSPGYADTGDSSTSGYYFGQNVIATGEILARDFAPFWSNIGSIIAVDNGPYALSLSEAIDEINKFIDGSLHTIFARTQTVDGIDGTAASGQQMLWYTKVLYTGQSIENKYDAQGLNYYGNALWSAKPLVKETSGKNLLYYGTAGSHSIPLQENLFYLSPEYNYNYLKKPLIDLTNKYVNSTSGEKQYLLAKLNESKDLFCAKIRELSVSVLNSPRGQMAYPNSIIAAGLERLDMKFGVRTTPNDITGIGITIPVRKIIGDKNNVRGEVSTGLFERKSSIGTLTKSGLGVTIDVSKWDRSCWTHQNPLSVGINVKYPIYSGPGGILGGSIWQITQDNRGILYGNTSNTPYLSGPTGTDGEYEKYITREGLYIPPSLSVSQAFDIEKNKIIQNVPLYNIAYGSATVASDTFLTSDESGRLYGISTKTGKIIMSIDASADDQPMYGGPASPYVNKLTNEVFWISQSQSRFTGSQSGGKWGWVLHPNKQLEIHPCHEFLNNKEFTAILGSLEAKIKWTMDGHDKYSVTLEYDGKISEYIANINCNYVSFTLVKLGDSAIRLKSGQLLTKISFTADYEKIESNDIQPLGHGSLFFKT